MRWTRLGWEAINMALGALVANRQRSLLTMLGVGTGIFAIVGILTMVNSLQQSLTSNLSSLGNTTLFVHHWPWAEGGQDWYKFMGRPKVSFEDFRALRDGLSEVEAISYDVSLKRQTLRSQGRSVDGIDLTGVTQQALTVKAMQFQAGRYFTEMEAHLGSPVCIIGHSIAANLFPQGDAVGQTLRVGGKRLRVIGVMKEQGATLFPGMPTEDTRLYVPYRFLAGRYNLSRRSIDKVITIKARDYSALPLVESQIEGIVRTVRGLGPRDDNNFAINKQEALMDRFEQFFGYLDLGGWVISIFSILIGGFSIGNIMYISVRERTMEIGVQKALGSTRGFILYQFLVESVLLCLLGGVLGLLAIMAIGGLVQLLLNAISLPLTVAFALKDVATGLGLSVGIGLISGFMPALIAARMDPVEAIRQ